MDIETQIEEIINRIILKRKQKGWTHENMASELDISTATYHKIENQVTKLSLIRFLQICEILEIQMEEIFGLVGNIYNQEFRDHSDNQLIQNIYHDNKELTERYINRLEKEIENLKGQ
jgi:DNA-binding XRE family transcriptional regulator